MKAEYPKVSVRYEAEIHIDQKDKIIKELQNIIKKLAIPPLPKKDLHSIYFMTDETTASEIKYTWRPK